MSCLEFFEIVLRVKVMSRNPGNARPATGVRCQCCPLLSHCRGPIAVLLHRPILEARKIT